MDDAAVMRRGEPGAKFARRLQGLIGGQPADARQQRGQVFAVHVFHGNERHALDLADVVDAADIGVGDLARHAHLAVESLQQPLVLGGFFGQEFQRHRLAQHQVGGAIDFAHAAAAQQADDAIPPAQQRAGDEAAFVYNRCGSDLRDAGRMRRGRGWRRFQRGLDSGRIDLPFHSNDSIARGRAGLRRRRYRSGRVPPSRRRWRSTHPQSRRAWAGGTSTSIASEDRPARYSARLWPRTPLACR